MMEPHPPPPGILQIIGAWIFSGVGQAFLAGALGGAVRWMTLREDWRQGLISLAVGGICAVYLGPLASTVMDTALGQIIEDELARRNLGTFAVGIGGIGAVGFVMDLWNLRRATLKNNTVPTPPAPPEREGDQ